MAQALLGLDIGTTNIKGVRLAKGLRGLRLLSSFEQTVPGRQGPSEDDAVLSKEQLAVLNEMILDGRIGKGDLIAISLPRNFVSTRELNLPFSDPKKLQQIVPYEVEGELAYDLEDVTIDYSILKKRIMIDLQEEKEEAPVPETRLLVSAVPNERLKAYLDLLQPMGIDPAWIGFGPLGLETFSQYFLNIEEKETEGQPNDLDQNDRNELLVIDVGASRTVLCGIEKGELNWVRTIPLGGDHLTESLQEDLDLSWEEAEERKKTIQMDRVNATEEQSKEIVSLKKGLSLLMAEIEKSIRVFHPERRRPSPSMDDEEEKVPSFFHLCGGSGALKGFQDLLSDVLGMAHLPVDVGPGSRAATITGMESVQANYVSYVYAQALGLAIQAGEDGPSINFRKGEFVFGKETIARRHQLVTIGVFFVVLLGLMGADLYLHSRQKEARYQTVKETLRTTFKEMFPEIRNVVNEVEQTRSAIDKLGETEHFLGVTEKSPLLVLKEITESIPTSVNIDVFDIVIDGGKVRIQAQTNSFDSVDKIRGGLLKAKHFEAVEVSDAKAMSDQSKVRFRIKMSVIVTGMKRRQGGKK
ncbi:MAG: pilus assembly protein PilM [Nitrospiria bacterium]